MVWQIRNDYSSDVMSRAVQHIDENTYENLSPVSILVSNNRSLDFLIRNDLSEGIYNALQVIVRFFRANNGASS